MTTVPVTAPLVPVPAIVELAIVPVPVPAGTIRPVWTVGVGAAGPVPVRTVRPVGVRTIRAVPIRTVRTICAGTIWAVWPVGALRAIGAVRPIGAPRLVRLIPAGTVRPVWAIGTLSFWTIRAVGSLVIGALAARALRTLGVRPRFRSRLVRTRLIGTGLIGTRLGALAALWPCRRDQVAVRRVVQSGVGRPRGSGRVEAVPGPGPTEVLRRARGRRKPPRT